MIIWLGCLISFFSDHVQLLSTAHCTGPARHLLSSEDHTWKTGTAVSILFSNFRNFNFRNLFDNKFFFSQFLIHLWPSDAIWRHRSGSTLAQVMACCLMALSHYLNQCWLTISKVPWHSPEGISIRSSADTCQRNKIENWIFEIASRFPRGQWINPPGAEACIFCEI